MIQYLLGELSEKDSADFEQACFHDDELFEELLAVEAELMDDYVRGVLVGRRRAQFDKRLLNSPGRRDEMVLARLIAHRSRK
ncbi:MAG TPA: hypothetical protein VFV34_11080 [Blastocatellia bacterium]|nr:hypothetical protein [Blastocatellia bacterium]